MVEELVEMGHGLPLFWTLWATVLRLVVGAAAFLHLVEVVVTKHLEVAVVVTQHPEVEAAVIQPQRVADYPAANHCSKLLMLQVLQEVVGVAMVVEVLAEQTSLQLHPERHRGPECNIVHLLGPTILWAPPGAFCACNLHVHVHHAVCAIRNTAHAKRGSPSASAGDASTLCTLCTEWNWHRSEMGHRPQLLWVGLCR